MDEDVTGEWVVLPYGLSLSTDDREPRYQEILGAARNIAARVGPLDQYAPDQARRFSTEQAGLLMVLARWRYGIASERALLRSWDEFTRAVPLRHVDVAWEAA